MGSISQREFDIRQPYFPEKGEYDGYYLQIANGLLTKIGETEYGKSLGEGLGKHLALTLTGYFQDIICDAGLWRSFVDANRELYGYSVPFHTAGEAYIDYELNVEDIRFLVWYDVAMLDMNRRLENPHNPHLLTLADTLHDYLEAHYDDSPINEKYNIARGLEFTDADDQESIFHLARWLFSSSWLLTPAFAITLSEIANDSDVLKDDEGILLNQRLDEAVSKYPTGPLALYVQEWVYLMLKGKLPASALDADTDETAVHPYYERFTSHTGGREIAYFSSYESLNEFFISALGWEKGEEHLANMKGHKNYVLLVNRRKGMLMAVDVAQCIADPDNGLYDANAAKEDAIDLLTVRGRCPADLLKYIYAHNWLPEAEFPQSSDLRLVDTHWDLIARCYLQEYYRGD